jgi:DNA-directed RNA polymerase omega subunit
MGNKVSMQALIEKTDNIYKLVRVAAMRAKELNMGGKSLLDKVGSKNYSTIALQEIIAGKIKIMEKSEAEKLTNPALKLFKDLDKEAAEKTEEKE